ncbi:MAG: hypothetical protein ABI876_16975, partial [Bacteroidota bacterium]
GVSGSVRIDRPASDGGTHIDLSSSFPRLAGVPADGVTIPAGNTTQRFDITIPPSISNPNKLTVMRVQALTAIITATDRRWNVSISDTLAFRPPSKPTTPPVTNIDSLRRAERLKSMIIKPKSPLIRTVPK